MNMASFERSLRFAIEGVAQHEFKRYGERTAKLASVVMCHPDHVQGFISRIVPFKTSRLEKNNRNGDAKQKAYQSYLRMNSDVIRLRKGQQEFEQFKAIKELVEKGELTARALNGWRFARAEREGVDLADPE